MKHLLLFFATLCSTYPIAAQPLDRAFVRPPYLRRGDTVAIVAPARKLAPDADTARARQRLERWGLHVVYADHLFDRSQPYFAASDGDRAADLQAMIDDPSVKAILAWQGGYGSVRLLPMLDLTPLRSSPKWIAGFSDVTMLHLALSRIGVESLHATMPALFCFEKRERDPATRRMRKAPVADADDVSAESLRRALFGLSDSLRTVHHPFDRPGTARGRIAGGNLSLLCAAIGTPEELAAREPVILFIEEVGERMYHLDRMMRQLERSGLLTRAEGILVGHFSRMNGQAHFGVEDPYAIIRTFTDRLNIPVAFGIEAGHDEPNRALYLGREATLTVGAEGAELRYH